MKAIGRKEILEEKLEKAKDITYESKNNIIKIIL